MIAIQTSFGIVLCIGFVGASIGSSVQQSISQPDKQEYRAAIPNSDKNKFGYELAENKHFHHTTQEEDGVRLGCYGHVLEGKKYSTQYVADAKGYRVVNTHDLITVYPRSGGERKASFIRDFSEDVIMSQNIAFFFPDGCGKEKEPVAAESRQNVVSVPAPVTTPRYVSREPISRYVPTSTPRYEATPQWQSPAETDTCPPPKCVCTCT